MSKILIAFASFFMVPLASAQNVDLWFEAVADHLAFPIQGTFEQGEDKCFQRGFIYKRFIRKALARCRDGADLQASNDLMDEELILDLRTFTGQHGFSAGLCKYSLSPRIHHHQTTDQEATYRCYAKYESMRETACDRLKDLSECVNIACPVCR